MRAIKYIKRLAVITCALMISYGWMSFPVKASRMEPDSGYYTVQDVDGRALFMIAEDVGTDDEYISGDNKLYRIVTVDETAQKAVAQYVEDVQMNAGTDYQAAQMSAPQNQSKTICLYSTHSDESFVPTDGTASNDNRGGILDVADTLAQNLDQKGVKAVMDETNHLPHDAGAYRRSRQTAVKLMKENQPAMLLDIHRDAVPPNEYDKNINGEETSAARIVIGRSNQNQAANKETAMELKKIADQKYPGLIKDIFIGHGSYNQDLMPNAILIEIGTHTIGKDKAETATSMLADVIATYVGASNATATPQATAGNNQGQPAPAVTGTNPLAQQQGARTGVASRGTWMGILWAVGLVVVLGVVFLILTTRRGHRGEKFAGYVKEQTGLGGRRENKGHDEDSDQLSHKDDDPK